jgi:DNA-binding NarL/FixJ family response regulator
VAQPITVFLVDDHEVVRQGLRALLEDDGDIEVIGEAGGAKEAVVGIVDSLPAVAVLDVRLPDGNGVEVCREVRSRHPEVACVILTSFADDRALADAVLAGASAYVLKEVRGSDLVSVVRKVAHGHSLIDPDVVAGVMARLTNTRNENPPVHLTAQERRILDFIAQGKTNREIADEMFLAEKTVKNYVSNLLAKLGMHHRTEAAVWAVQNPELADRG